MPIAHIPKKMLYGKTSAGGRLKCKPEPLFECYIKISLLTHNIGT